MLEILQYATSSFWVFCGVAILLMIVSGGVGRVISAVAMLVQAGRRKP